MECPSKRAKAPGNISQVVHCLVDGCNADLNLCRDYHRRHKVCQVHSKTAKVTIGGREQRFCQQCSRFHSLVEFDDGKRSCRKHLDGHNRRRRKPQPDSLARNDDNTRLVLSAQLLSFNKPETYNQHHASFNATPFPSNSVVSNNQIQFLQGDDNLDPDHALSLLSSAGPETGNAAAESSASSLATTTSGSNVWNFPQHGSSAGGSHQTLTFTWE